MDVELSSQYDQLVEAFYDLRNRFKEASRDERLIVEAAIHLLEYLPRYKDSVDHEEADWTPEAIERMSKRIRPPRTSRFTWSFEDFERYIASGGVELHAGYVEPRF